MQSVSPFDLCNKFFENLDRCLPTDKKSRLVEITICGHFVCPARLAKQAEFDLRCTECATQLNSAHMHTAMKPPLSPEEKVAIFKAMLKGNDDMLEGKLPTDQPPGNLRIRGWMIRHELLKSQAESRPKEALEPLSVLLNDIGKHVEVIPPSFLNTIKHIINVTQETMVTAGIQAVELEDLQDLETLLKGQMKKINTLIHLGRKLSFNPNVSLSVDGETFTAPRCVHESLCQFRDRDLQAAISGDNQQKKSIGLFVAQTIENILKSSDEEVFLWNQKKIQVDVSPEVSEIIFEQASISRSMLKALLEPSPQ